MRLLFGRLAVALGLICFSVLPVKAGERIVVGLYHKPPLMITAPERAPSGFVPDVIRAIAAREGWEVDFRTGTWFDCARWLAQGDIDLLGGVAFSGEGARRFEFGQEPLLIEWGQLIVPRNASLDAITDLAGKKVAVRQGDVHYLDLLEVMQRFGLHCRFIEAEDYETVVLLVAAGRCQAGIVNQYYNGLHEVSPEVAESPLVFSPCKLFFATRQGFPRPILAAIDRQLWQLKSRADSPYQQALPRWFVPREHLHLPRWGYWLACGIGLLTLALTLHAFLLRRSIRTQTRELSSRNLDLSLEIQQRRQAEDHLSRQKAYLAALHETTLGLIRRLDLNELLQALIERAGALLNVAEGYIYLYDEERQTLVLRAGLGAFARVRGHQIAPGEGLVGQVWAEGTAHGVDDYQSWPRRLAKPVTESLRCLYAVPLKSGEHVNGVIGFAHCSAEKGFGEDQKSILAQFAELAAIAIDNAQLYTRLQQELSERKRMEAQLLQAQKMEAIGTLAGGIAHDFNNILGAMVGYTELSLYELSERHRARRNLEQVLQAGNRARDLVKQILAFSRKSESDRRLMNLVPITKEVLKLLRASLPSTIEIRADISKKTGLIVADPTQIHQVLMNLCTNAAHAMEDKGGELEVRVAPLRLATQTTCGATELPAGDYVQLVVRDTGQGIDPAIMDRIFEPYFTTKEMDKGTGMGLAVVHGIVTSQKGRIRVQSALGRGTEFDILFPVAEQITEPLQRCDEPLVQGCERVLFVDDEPALADLGKSMLERLGYEVHACTSPLEALETFRSAPERYDILVTDLTMPHLTGINLAGELRRLRRDLPVLICTGYSEAVGEQHARALGIDGFLPKPLLLQDLSREIRRALGNSCAAATLN
jgi:signal transduction histidine kinase/ActR/RegA family two-component response regulator